MPEGVSGRRGLRSHARAWSGVGAVWLGVLACAGISGIVFDNATFSDADGFANAGRVLLSAHWRSTFDDPWLQAGPFEQLICLLGRTLGVNEHGEPVALNALGAAALLLVACLVFGRDWRATLYVGAGALGLGIVTDLYAIGHPSELFIALLWLLAARSARRDAAVGCGLLLGLSAGLETWGLLGAPILLFLPTLRRSFAGGCVALTVAVSLYAPFASGDDFHMFDLHWSVAGGLASTFFEQGSAFTWRMRVAEALIVVGFGVAFALLLRSRTGACVWIVPAATSILRLLLDPVRYPYYWDTALTLMLFGTAPWVTSPQRVAAALRRRLVQSEPAAAA